MSTTTRTTRAALTATALAAGLLLTACGSGDGPAAAGSTSSSSTTGPAAQGPHSDVDIAFATQMVPHHTQAVAMADLALAPAPAGAGDPRVRDLAERIEGEQDAEIATMTGWLAGWGAPAPDSPGGAGSSGMTGMTGMMSESEMASLATSSGAAFDRTWVQLMLAHHRGAVVMAQVEQRDGQNPDAQALAGSIIAGQSAEIDEMTALAAQLPG